MGFTTPPPRFDVLSVSPQLQQRVATTVRLHPRKGEVAELGASKIGGMFLWPDDEPWPTAPDPGPPEWYRGEWERSRADLPLLPVLQLHSADVPEMAFPPGADLFQLLWCSVNHHSPISVAKPFVFWRWRADVVSPRKAMPELGYEPEFKVNPCQVFAERVAEYPAFHDLSDEDQRKWDELELGPLADDVIDCGSTLYEWELSVADGTKVGGNVFWVQHPEIPTCTCGSDMEYLLTLACAEWNLGTYRRWCPVENQANWQFDRDAIEAAYWELNGRQHIFICRRCEGWSIQSVFQR